MEIEEIDVGVWNSVWGGVLDSSSSLESWLSAAQALDKSIGDLRSEIRQVSYNEIPTGHSKLARILKITERDLDVIGTNPTHRFLFIFGKISGYLQWR